MSSMFNEDRKLTKRVKEKKSTESGIAKIKSGKDERNTSRMGCVIRDSAEALSYCLNPDYGNNMPGVFKGHDKADKKESY